MATIFETYELKAKEKLMIKLLEQILEKLTEINESIKGSRPSPS